MSHDPRGWTQQLPKVTFRESRKGKAALRILIVDLIAGGQRRETSLITWVESFFQVEVEYIRRDASSSMRVKIRRCFSIDFYEYSSICRVTHV